MNVTLERSSSASVVAPVQYLRALAALMVVWHHARGQETNAGNWFPWQFGATGVDVFFVISGFIMVVSTAEQRVSPAQFLWRRIVRVVPLYWIATGTMVFAWWLHPAAFRTLQVGSETLLKSLVFVPHFSSSFPMQVWPLLVPGWTLNFEMFFYLVFAVSLALPATWQRPGVALLMSMLVACGVALGPFHSPMLLTYTSPMLLEFVGGMLLASAWLRRPVRSHGLIAAALVIVGFVLLSAREWSAHGEWIAITGAVLIVAGSIRAATRPAGSRLLMALGDASYSIYLTHLFALGALRKAWEFLPMAGSQGLPAAMGFMAASLLGSIAVGLACYRFIELPMTARLRRVTLKRVVSRL